MADAGKKSVDQAPTGVLFAGVGGQGIILASELLAEAALAAGFDVKKSEVHGMAQRGGSVISHVRFGAKVHSPLIPEGEAEFLVSFEEMESLRYLHLLRPGGLLIINRQRIQPLSILLGKDNYPEDSLRSLRQLPIEVIEVDGPVLARQAGNARTVNLVVLGCLAARLSLQPELWREVIAAKVPPKFVDVNWAAFQKGYAAA